MNDATWVTWAPRGHDPYTNPRSRVAHAAPASVGRTENVSSGGFPLACGRYAPDGWDANFHVDPYARRCRRCELALARRAA